MRITFVTPSVKAQGLSYVFCGEAYALISNLWRTFDTCNRRSPPPVCPHEGVSLQDSSNWLWSSSSAKAYKYHSTLPSYLSNPFLGGYRAHNTRSIAQCKSCCEWLWVRSPFPEWFDQFFLPYTAEIARLVQRRLDNRSLFLSL